MINVRGCAALLPALCSWVLLLASCGGASNTSEPSESQQAMAPADESAPPAGTAAAENAAGEPSEDPALQPQAASGAVPGVPAPTNTAPIVAVANYFTELPGFDVAALKPRQREKFLQRVNSEICTCGCKNDTLAHCHVNDPRCPVVKGMIQKVYDEAKSGR